MQYMSKQTNAISTRSLLWILFILKGLDMITTAIGLQLGYMEANNLGYIRSSLFSIIFLFILSLFIVEAKEIDKHPLIRTLLRFVTYILSGIYLIVVANNIGVLI